MIQTIIDVIEFTDNRFLIRILIFWKSLGCFWCQAFFFKIFL